MIGFIKKELLMITQNLKVFLIMFIVFLGLAFMNAGNMIYIFPVMCVMLVISTFSYDSFNKWDAYVATLPNGRKNAVGAKYVTSCIVVLIGCLLSMAAQVILTWCGISADLTLALVEMVACSVASLFIVVMMFPILYRYGVEKGRIMLFVIVFGGVGILTLISQYVDIRIPAGVGAFVVQYAPYLIPVILGILLVISYQISKRIYCAKEF